MPGLASEVISASREGEMCPDGGQNRPDWATVTTMGCSQRTGYGPPCGWGKWAVASSISAERVGVVSNEVIHPRVGIKITISAPVTKRDV